MTKKKWSKVRTGELVELGGRPWELESARLKKGKLRVTVRSGTRRVESRVDPDEKVKLAEATPATRRAPSRAAKPKPPPTTPPMPAAGDPWETQQDRIEKMLSRTLGAVLVGEATDVDAGYYVPPLDVTTVASHLALFHGVDIGGRDLTEDQLLELHARAHLSAENGGDALLQNHWHTDVRPTSKSKK